MMFYDGSSLYVLFHAHVDETLENIDQRQDVRFAVQSGIVPKVFTTDGLKLSARVDSPFPISAQVVRHRPGTQPRCKCLYGGKSISLSLEMSAIYSYGYIPFHTIRISNSSLLKYFLVCLNIFFSKLLAIHKLQP